jgi:hypothetical protein
MAKEMPFCKKEKALLAVLPVSLLLFSPKTCLQKAQTKWSNEESLDLFGAQYPPLAHLHYSNCKRARQAKRIQIMSPFAICARAFQSIWLMQTNPGTNGPSCFGLAWIKHGFAFSFQAFGSKTVVFRSTWHDLHCLSCLFINKTPLLNR